MSPLSPASDPLWYKDAIIYEVHVKSFFDSNDDGYGDFPGLTAKLDYIQELGVNTIWLLPFYPSPLKDDGYDIADYHGFNPVYGNRRDFKHFIREAHRRGLRVITELVVNHTSDQHPWFQAARKAPPGSSKRDFYVWSDTTEKYKDTRIIFTDTETSNWTWDPEAKAYYWHRFFHHQPDLNFDNPKVRKAIEKIMRYWLDMGVDGFRLDAIPYLIERDGTNCENLPETHDLIKEWRRVMDEHYEGRIFLAEANQWPSDVRAYFGDGDECHMAYHFPIMPRIFMALHQEDRYPVTEIMRQTPDIPYSCQWAIFLRNHDELTLEMVTDEERDYMYKAYAYDPMMKINVGIRRRLAPLLEHNRRGIELLNNLLLSLPGSPIIYYGDEIGMGDNIFLGDRNGVRTPMQWNNDRNGGFSRADFAKLYCAPNMDPIHGYQAVNVEAQLRDQSSLLNWMRRIIAIRKKYKVFGRGTIEFLHPENRKILAFIRRYNDETVLVVSNLSRFSQPVTLDLSTFKGSTPVEMFGLVEFPQIVDDKYQLTLGPHSFYWFLLCETPMPIPVQSISKPAPEVAGEEMEAPPQIVLENGWDSLFVGKPLETLKGDIIPVFLEKQPWAKFEDATLLRTEILDWFSINTNNRPGYVVIVEAGYSHGETRIYLVPISIATGEDAEQILDEAPETVMGHVQTSLKDNRTTENVVLYDGLTNDNFCASLMTDILAGKPVKTQKGTVRIEQTDAFRKLDPDSKAVEPVARLGTIHTHSSLRFGKDLLLKLFHCLEYGINPDYELGRHLTEKTGFTQTPKVYGAIEYEDKSGRKMVLGILREMIYHQGDGWGYTVDELRRFYERASGRMYMLEDITLVRDTLRLTLPELATREDVPEDVQMLLGFHLREAATLGKRTGEMHLALAADTTDPAFAPETIAPADLRELARNMKDYGARVLDHAAEMRDGLSDDLGQALSTLLNHREVLFQRFDRMAEDPPEITRIRVQGNFHLEHVFNYRGDFLIRDFEGELYKPVEERRTKQTPIKDMAVMLQSLNYATYGSLFTFTHNRPEDFTRFLPWAKFCQNWTDAIFIQSYSQAVNGASFMPARVEDFYKILDGFVLEKALHELEHDLRHRPEWSRIPVMSLLGYLNMEF